VGMLRCSPKLLFSAHRVIENAPNITLATISASDLDSGENSELHFSIVGGDSNGDFLLDDNRNNSGE